MSNCLWMGGDQYYEDSVQR